jgi:predicted DNA-binding protein YlxM (UPF0122 family)
MGRSPKDINEIKRLYVDEELTLQEVGDRVGLTRQGVHERLKYAGIPSRMRKVPHYKMRLPLVARDALWKLYVVECLTIKAVADRLGFSCSAVYRMLKTHDIPRRKGPPLLEKYNRLRTLDLGETAIIEGLNSRGMYVSIYVQAKRNGMKYSVHKLSRSSVRVTRIG